MGEYVTVPTFGVIMLTIAGLGSASMLFLAMIWWGKDITRRDYFAKAAVHYMTKRDELQQRWDAIPYAEPVDNDKRGG